VRKLDLSKIVDYSYLTKSVPYLLDYKHKPNCKSNCVGSKGIWNGKGHINAMKTFGGLKSFPLELKGINAGHSRFIDPFYSRIHHEASDKSHSDIGTTEYLYTDRGFSSFATSENYRKTLAVRTKHDDAVQARLKAKKIGLNIAKEMWISTSHSVLQGFPYGDRPHNFGGPFLSSIPTILELMGKDWLYYWDN
jgi:hypothetical protein